MKPLFILAFAIQSAAFAQEISVKKLRLEIQPASGKAAVESGLFYGRYSGNHTIQRDKATIIIETTDGETLKIPCTFSIPNMFGTIGASITLSQWSKLKNWNGRRVRDLFGSYWGPLKSLVPVAGPRVITAINNNGVIFADFSWRYGLKFDGGTIAEVNLEPTSEENLDLVLIAE